MDEYLLSFEYPIGLLGFAVLLGLLYAYFMYGRNVWQGHIADIMLFGLRALLVTLLLTLLLKPMMQLVTHITQKPSVIFLADNSLSIQQALDSTQCQEIYKQLRTVMHDVEEQGFKTKWETLGETKREDIVFDANTSNLAGRVAMIEREQQDENLAALVVISDGIYNSGVSPLYSPTRTPLYIVGVGDTVQSKDLYIKQLFYNKEVYQGHQFVLRSEVMVRGISKQNITVAVRNQGRVIVSQQRYVIEEGLYTFEFILETLKEGLQQWSVEVMPVDEEKNVMNNRVDAYVEVVGSQKNILLISPSPHPDHKALRAVVEQNKRYHWQAYISTLDAPHLILNDTLPNLVILHRLALYSSHALRKIIDTLRSQSIPMLVILGKATTPSQLSIYGFSDIAHTPASKDSQHQASPMLNLRYGEFDITDGTSIVMGYAPINVPSVRVKKNLKNKMILWQHEMGDGKIAHPMLFTTEHLNRKIAYMLGEGFWQWRLGEYVSTGKTFFFDDIFTKLIQYLCASSDRKKFRCQPVQDEFATMEDVVFRSQMYNDILEPVFGNAVTLTVAKSGGSKKLYRYVINREQTTYAVGKLEEGIYTYTASTIVDGKKEMVRGTFIVTAHRLELQNLQADFDLLRTWAKQSGGIFFRAEDMQSIKSSLQQKNYATVTYKQKSVVPLVDVSWLGLALILLVTVEWVVRKYRGMY